MIELKLSHREFRLLVLAVGVTQGMEDRLEDLSGKRSGIQDELERLQEKIIAADPSAHPPQMVAVG